MLLLYERPIMKQEDAMDEIVRHLQGMEGTMASTNEPELQHPHEGSVLKE